MRTIKFTFVAIVSGVTFAFGLISTTGLQAVTSGNVTTVDTHAVAVPGPEGDTPWPLPSASPVPGGLAGA
ncbi:MULTISPECIES: hypothetical protein [unclassified Micromonospora]|uniref:hypothetical protein n=1 Tax=unclassified Micromonospora TaxID=2617518 RepID=UPI003644C9B5